MKKDTNENSKNFHSISCETKGFTREDCFLCRDELPYGEYIQDCRGWDARPVEGLEKKLVLKKNDCVEVEFSLEIFTPMADFNKIGFLLVEPTKKYVHKECGEKYLKGKHKNIRSFQWQHHCDDLVLKIKDVEKMKELEGKTTHIKMVALDKGHFGSSYCGNCNESFPGFETPKKCGECGYTFKGVKSD